MLARAIAKIFDTFTKLTDAPSSYSGQAGNFVKVKGDETGLEFGTGGGGAATFLDLTDSPSSYSGQAGLAVYVKSDETGLEFTSNLVVDGASFLDTVGDIDRTVDGGSFV